MAFQIEDGKGSGNRAEVNAEKQLVVSAVTASELEHESEDGQSYNWSSKKVNIDSGDTVLLLKNTSDNHLHIDSIIISGDATSEYTVHLPTSEVTPTGGSLVTGTTQFTRLTG